MDNHECWRRTREVGRFKKPTIIDDEHGGLGMGGHFAFDGSSQGWGFRIDIDFIQKFMEVFNVRTLSELEGKACWVTHCNSAIHLVEPLLPEEGTAFNVDAWAAEAQARSECLRQSGLDQWSIDERARKDAAEAKKIAAARA